MEYTIYISKKILLNNQDNRSYFRSKNFNDCFQDKFFEEHTNGKHILEIELNRKNMNRTFGEIKKIKTVRT